MTNTNYRFDNTTPRTGKITLKYSGNCFACGQHLFIGNAAWYARNNGQRNRDNLRCMTCGPHPGLQGPKRDRKTIAEGLNMGPRKDKAEGVEGGILKDIFNDITPPESTETETEIQTDKPVTEISNSELESLRKEVKRHEKEIGVLIDANLLLTKQISNLREKAPVVIEVKTEKSVKIVEGAHKKLKDILRLVSAGVQNVYMVGPAGSGKTTLAQQLATAMDRPFAFLSLSGGVNETHLLGRVLPQADGSWQYQKSQFVRAYEEGGVFLLDEVDAADPNVMVTINAALANGHLANPVAGVVHNRHKDTIIICAANTFGTGADAQFVGRNALDAATLDRFVCATIQVDYDESIEEQIVIANVANEKLGIQFLSWVWDTRKKARETRLRRTVGTRLVLTGAKLLANGFTLTEVKENFFQGWSEDEKRKVS